MSKQQELREGDLPAFPMIGGAPTGKFNLGSGVPEVMVVVQSGMTLRDWFAGQALKSFLKFEGEQIGEHVYDFKNVCSDAYRIADAMLKQRAL